MKSSIVAVCLFLAIQAGFAQQKPAAASPDETRKVLVEKAHALDARGRPDLAIQLWQQILLSAPNNSEALAGLAKDFKLTGATDKSNAILERLRNANPSDPNIAKIASLNSTNAQSDRLRQAGQLARQGKNEDAMRIYRDLFGDRPPDGDIALAYYQTLYGTASGKPAAIAGLRALAQRNPGDTRDTVQLGILLTYDPKTRAEGIRILQAHSKDADVQAALRQALVWSAANPASAGELRQYLKEHPQDTELSGQLKEDEAKLAQMNSGVARSAADKEVFPAFAALNAHRLEEAESRFKAILDHEPKNGRAAAGMGFLRMRQNNFAGAISYLTQAEQNGYKNQSVENALVASRFWFTMGEASQALNENQYEEAAAKYKAALAIQPRSPEALRGLAGLMVKEQQFTNAAGLYEQLIQVQPGSAEGWRGLFLVYARDGQNHKALEVVERFPAAVKASLAGDPEYLRTLATVYHAENRSADAQRVLAQALSLPFPGSGTNLKEDTRLQFAGILMGAKRYAQAVELYTQILNEDASNLLAWMGLVNAHHELGQDKEAIADVERMSPSTYETALSDSGFLVMLGSIYQQANQYDIAQGLLERAAKLEIASGGQPTIPLQLQLAAIYLERNDTAQAYAIYRRVLEAHPDRLDAWKGLIASLQSTNHNTEAIQELALIPPAMRRQLETDIEFVEGEASLYAAAGNTAQAIETMRRVQVYYAGLKTLAPVNVEIQYAWLLLNTGNDRALYPALMRLGGRQDLTIPQRETVQDIWANWSVRRAGKAMDNGNLQRAIDILDAASQAFPDNLTVRKAVAGGYAQVGRTRESVALFKTVPMQDASAGDFQGAVGAALAANDKTQAELWLRQALDRFPRNSSILSLAARFEQSRGDSQRAADYWRASLAAMPEASPADRLAHNLAYPDQDERAHRAVTAADLSHLLDPNYEPFQKTVKLPPLPSYGADPYGEAPVDLSRPTQQSSQAPLYPSPLNQAPLRSQWTTPPIAAEAPSSVASSDFADASSLMAEEANQRLYIQPSAAPVAVSGLPAPRTVAGAGTLYAEQTGGQPMQGFATDSHAVPGAPVSPVAIEGDRLSGSARYNLAQYTSSAQEADTGAYSAPRQQAAPLQATPAQTEPATARDAQPAAVTHRKKHRKARHHQAASQWSALATAPVAQLPQPQLPQQAEVQTEEQQLTFAPATPATSPVSPIAIQSEQLSGSAQYTLAQYTPSAQEAASGAYSKPRQQAAPLQATPAQTEPATARDAQPAAVTHRKKHRKAKHFEAAAIDSASPISSSPTLATAPAAQLPQAPLPLQAEVQTEVQQPANTTPVNPGAGLSDEELQQRNLPPLRGPWVRVQREQRPPSPRDEAETQLRSIQSGYSPWIGGAGVLNHRSGDLGFDHLTALEAPFEVSMPLGYNARLTFIAKPVFLDSGQATGSSLITVQEFLTTTSTTLTAIPQPLGTKTNTDTAPPPQQNATGVAFEAQLALKHLALAGGVTPAGFLVSTFTARAQWKPNNGPFTFNFVREPVRDTQLSYAGLRDPGSASLSFPGNIWGGVVTNQGNVQYSRGNAESGFYLGAGGQHLTGYNVEENDRIDGSAGAYWRVKTMPEYGNLNVGVNFFAMHYSHNEDAFTWGMGGYFSPKAYFLANVPFSWNGHSGTNWHYNILGSLGVQAFQEDMTPLFPLASTTATEVFLNNAQLPAKTSVGPNYDVRSQVAYQISPHWYAGGFFGANNSRNYSAVSTGFYVRYLFREQPSTVATPTGIFPVEGFRPFSVP